MTDFEAWGADRVDDLLGLVRATPGADDLTVDELLLSCHERGGAVLAASGIGAVAVAVGRADDGALLASVRLAVTDGPESAGRLDALLVAAEEWARARSAARIVIGGGLPFSLWPGAVAESPLADAALSRGFALRRSWTAWHVPASFRADPPSGVEVRRAVRDDDVALVLVESAARWPRRSDEIALALDHGTCHVAIDASGDVDVLLGVATHSIARAGWTGPVGVVDVHRRRGIGRALLGQVCRDLMIAEFDGVVVADVPDDATRAFLSSVGATPTMSLVTLERDL